MILPTGKILVVDDDLLNRTILSHHLHQSGHEATVAEDGRQALELLRTQPFDIVLLDVLMPHMNGYQVLEQMKADTTLRHIPVIIISALDEMESVVRCIKLGADDYLPKSFDPVFLEARVNASLSKKRLHDLEQEHIRLVKSEQAKVEQLLFNVLPKAIVERLKHTPDAIADSFDDATVLFADIVDFTPLAATLTPLALVRFLNEIFSIFDALVERHQLEKIKTIGDAYMIVSGLPVSRPDHIEAAANLALEMQAAIAPIRRQDGELVRIRIGIHSGPVVAGVIGTKRFVYDLWGDTVNTASRMESHGIPGAIQVTAPVYECLRERYRLEERGSVSIKGKGTMTTYLLLGRKEE
ncbi:MAG: response regulator [Ardenticatenales bacterium]|nr:response regulator [Ardenticatenales bacterium]